MIAPLVFRRFVCRPTCFFIWAALSIFVGGIYITLTWVAIATALSFQNLYDALPGWPVVAFCALSDRSTRGPSQRP
ncbi:hypothetical protein, partial [Pseudomonas syringae]|uniref:hypothetical protein n=1 Tax=Pseudomonas syringae TaxID=317 RepID=UPI001FEEA007